MAVQGLVVYEVLQKAPCHLNLIGRHKVSSSLDDEEGKTAFRLEIPSYFVCLIVLVVVV